MRRIVTSFQYPPIPDRSHDWCAHYDGEEEAGNYGWGRTEDEAVQDFKDNCQEDHDERLGIHGGDMDAPEFSEQDYRDDIADHRYHCSECDNYERDPIFLDVETCSLCGELLEGA